MEFSKTLILLQKSDNFVWLQLLGSKTHENLMINVDNITIHLKETMPGNFAYLDIFIKNKIINACQLICCNVLSQKQFQIILPTKL